MHRIPVLLAVLVAAASLVALAAAGAGRSAAGATVVIRHQIRHCHAWSVNGNAFAAAQRLSVKRGATVTFVDDDVMPHRLVELAGARVAMRNGSTMPMGMAMRGSSAAGEMSFMGATTSIRLAKPGVYRFRTRAGEDYRPGFETTGEDDVLTLTVTVR